MASSSLPVVLLFVIQFEKPFILYGKSILFGRLANRQAGFVTLPALAG
jgi:hypothetical protein